MKGETRGNREERAISGALPEKHHRNVGRGKLGSEDGGGLELGNIKKMKVWRLIGTPGVK